MEILNGTSLLVRSGQPDPPASTRVEVHGSNKHMCQTDTTEEQEEGDHILGFSKETLPRKSSWGLVYFCHISNEEDVEMTLLLKLSPCVREISRKF